MSEIRTVFPDKKPSFSLEKPPGKVIVVMGKPCEVPLTIHNLPKQMEPVFRFIFFGQQIVEARVEDSKLILTGKRPGEIDLGILLDDSLVPQITGHAEVDEPVRITVEVI
jgi:hypothetical protein